MILKNRKCGPISKFQKFGLPCFQPARTAVIAFGLPGSEKELSAHAELLYQSLLAKSRGQAPAQEPLSKIRLQNGRLSMELRKTGDGVGAGVAYGGINGQAGPAGPSGDAAAPAGPDRAGKEFWVDSRSGWQYAAVKALSQRRAGLPVRAGGLSGAWRGTADSLP